MCITVYTHFANTFSDTPCHILKTLIIVRTFGRSSGTKFAGNCTKSGLHLKNLCVQNTNEKSEVHSDFLVITTAGKKKTPKYLETQSPREEAHIKRPGPSEDD